MGGVEGFRVGNYDGYIYGKNDIVAGKTVGKNEGYKTLDEALIAAKKAGGAEVITEKDGKYFLNEVRGTHYSEQSENEVTVRAYNSANFAKVVAFCDDHDNVIAQFDNDPNLEKLGKIDDIRQKISSLGNIESSKALKIAGTLLGVGTPATYSTSKKIQEALMKVPAHLPEKLQEKFKDMVKPENIAILATVLTVYGASHAFGVGEAADVVIAAAGLAFLGKDAIKVAKDFYNFAETASNAKTEADLDKAASHLAEGVSTVLVDVGAAVVGAKVSQGIAKVGGKIKTGRGGNVAEPPTARASQTVGLKIPQGLTSEQFANLASTLRNNAKIAGIGDDIVVQGSRAAGTARPTSDIDIAIRVPADKFDAFIAKFFKNPNPGSAKEKTMLHAIKTGKIQAGEAKLSALRNELQKLLGMEVDISIIKVGGPFDNPPFVQLPK